jgi:HTH-type transcriptional regulator/antitoxin HipB
MDTPQEPEPEQEQQLEPEQEPEQGTRYGSAAPPRYEDRAQWTTAELEWYLLGPFEGGIPGLVRRVRRILDLSQRGLAALLEVSQSVVARWETGRTSPRASVLHDLLARAGLVARVQDRETGDEVAPMRDDGARDHADRRYPAHVDLRVTGWFYPRGVECSTDWWTWRRASRARQDPMVRYRTARWRRHLERDVFGTPEDHPAWRQLVAEAVHLDEKREDRAARQLTEREAQRPRPSPAA